MSHYTWQRCILLSGHTMSHNVHDHLCACPISAGTQLDDRYGSPSMEDMEALHALLTEKLHAAMGAAAADEIEIELSSPVSSLTCAYEAWGQKRSEKGSLAVIPAIQYTAQGFDAPHWQGWLIHQYWNCFGVESCHDLSIRVSMYRH